MYANGQGVAQDYKEAMRWYELAVEHGGVSGAEFNLGVMYDNGQGVPQDYKEAVRWYRMAAEQGQPDAGFNLGAMYVTGRGVSQDYMQAYKWFNIAATEGDEDSARARERLTARMTAPQIEQAQALAAAWKPCKAKEECEARLKQ